jgi:hypothetical protein
MTSATSSADQRCIAVAEVKILAQVEQFRLSRHLVAMCVLCGSRRLVVTCSMFPSVACHSTSSTLCSQSSHHRRRHRHSSVSLRHRLQRPSSHNAPRPRDLFCAVRLAANGGSDSAAFISTAFSFLMTCAVNSLTALHRGACIQAPCCAGGLFDCLKGQLWRFSRR